MDVNTIETEEQQSCTDYIYGEMVWDFLVKYDNNLEGVTQYLQPSCITIVNNQFLVAYKDYEEQAVDLFRVGYGQIPKCFGLMDLSAPQSIGVLQVQDFPGLSLRGKDVLVGFVDTGIDYRNAVFRKSDGKTRIHAIWDQTKEAFEHEQPGTGQIFGYGREYTKEIIDEALLSDDPLSVVPSMDLDGHGSFLASIACGNYYELEQGGSAFTGVAPDSDIVVVKLKQAKQNLRKYFLIAEDVPCYSEVDILLGIKYLINKAIQLRKPLVICLGIGTSQGDHNGNLNLEQYLDSIVSLPGICVVCSAGNELGSGGHFLSGMNRASVSVPENMQERTLKSTIEIYVNEANPGFCMEIWGKAPSLYRIVVVSPTGERFGSLVPNRDSASQITFLYEGTRVYGESIVVEYNSGDPLIFLRFEDVTMGIWKIEVTEMYNSFPVGYDAWLPIRAFRRGDVSFAVPDPEVILCSPANARGTITVAGYNHLDNALYINSSRGYTRKGRIQPDFASPAVDVFGLFAVGSEPLFIRKSGTSIAAAFTAGAAALLLEWGVVRGNNYAINTEVIRQLFIRGVEQPVDIAYPNVSFGWGVLNLFHTFEIIRNQND